MSRAKDCYYVGTGVSGGEEGARQRPEHHARRFARRVAARQGNFPVRRRQSRTRAPCCDWVGEGGAGHYVKMVHNGIEYGDMQLICEAYNILKNGLGLSAAEIHEVFAEWNTGELDSYFIEISRDILAFKDTDGTPLVDKILDTAGQKGTGKWTIINSQDLGIPITLIAEAVYCALRFRVERRTREGGEKIERPAPALTSIAANPEKKKQFIADIRDALYASKIISATRKVTCSCARRRRNTNGI